MSSVLTRTVSENFKVKVSLDKSKLNCISSGGSLSAMKSLALTVERNGGISLTELPFMSSIAELVMLIKVLNSEVATSSSLLISLRSLRPRYTVIIVESFSEAVLFCKV